MIYSPKKHYVRRSRTDESKPINPENCDTTNVRKNTHSREVGAPNARLITTAAIAPGHITVKLVELDFCSIVKHVMSSIC